MEFKDEKELKEFLIKISGENIGAFLLIGGVFWPIIIFGIFKYGIWDVLGILIGILVGGLISKILLPRYDPRFVKHPWWWWRPGGPEKIKEIRTDKAHKQILDYLLKLKIPKGWPAAIMLLIIFLPFLLYVYIYTTISNIPWHYIFPAIFLSFLGTFPFCYSWYFYKVKKELKK